MHNAFVHLDEGQLEKASEFLWGCMAQAIKAVAALQGIKLPTHAAIWEFMTRLCKDLGDPTLFDGGSNRGAIGDTSRDSPPF